MYTVGVNRIDAAFRGLKEGRKGVRGVIPFVCGGHPGPGVLGELLMALERGGAMAAEVGIPFSDPIADGPVISAAMHRALGMGATPRRVFEEVRGARAGLGMGLVAMVSASVVHRVGVERFVGEGAAAGFDGFLFPDVPMEECEAYRRAVEKAGCVMPMLVAPTTPAERVKRVAGVASGFVYVLARAGVTGERSDVPEVGGLVGRVRGVTRLPVACGFGISTRAQVEAVLVHADAAIVGSALVRRVEEAAEARRDVAEEAEGFVGGLTGVGPG